MIAGQYKVVQEFSGGMGVVHSCLDTVNEDFPVALKTFKQEFLADRAARDRFLREATVWVDLGAHPNIVQAYKVLHWAEDQSVYIVMQLIPTPLGFPDPSLKAQMDTQTKFSVERSLLIMLGIIRGMEHATMMIPSLIHRDLKPGNILIGTDGQPKITDFGLAGIRPDAARPPSMKEFNPYRRTLTESGGMGTPLYMSPEQWFGKQVDHRSDIYALGCILFELLTNQFAAYGNSEEEVFKAHLSGLPLNNVNRSSLSSTLKVLLGKCVNPHSQERFASWQELENEVVQILTNEYRIQIPVENNSIDVSRITQHQKAESFLAIGAGYINIGNYFDGQGYFEKAEQIAKEQGFPILLGLSIANQGVALSNQGYFEKAIALFQESIPIFEQLGEMPQVCYHTGNIGNAYFGLHEYENARRHLERAFRLAEKLRDPISQANWTGNLGNIYLATGEFRKALEVFQGALDISRKTQDRSSASKHLAGMASAYEALGDYRKSFEFYTLAMRDSVQIGDRQTEGLLHLSIGGLFTKQKRLDDGIKSLISALNIGKEIHDLNLTARASGNLATAYLLKNQGKLAIPLLEDAITLSKQIKADDIYARAHWSLGILAETQGDFRDAISHFRSAVVTFKELNMPEYLHASKHLLDLRKKLGLL